ncbi:helix-turn-helix domain-containing protein [Candidatus Nitrosoglobus terrae]
MKAYKLRFYSTDRQRKQLTKEFNACRYVWNWALKPIARLIRNEKRR